MPGAAILGREEPRLEECHYGTETDKPLYTAPRTGR